MNLSHCHPVQNCSEGKWLLLASAVEVAAGHLLPVNSPCGTDGALVYTQAPPTHCREKYMQLCVNSESPCLLLSLVTVDRMAMCLYTSACLTHSFVPRSYSELPLASAHTPSW